MLTERIKELILEDKVEHMERNDLLRRNFFIPYLRQLFCFPAMMWDNLWEMYAKLLAGKNNTGSSRYVKLLWMTNINATSGYATWFTAGGAIREPQNP